VISSHQLLEAGFTGMTGQYDSNRFILPGYSARHLWAEVNVGADRSRIVLRNDDGRELTGWVRTWPELLSACRAVGLTLPAEQPRERKDGE